jgi:hypothetical protein
MTAPSDRIQALNDAFRRTFIGGKVLMSAGIVALAEGEVDQILRAVRDYLSFNRDNDPHGEHDFGSFEIFGDLFFWKIDYYDKSLLQGSEDPSDPEKTTRVLTIMRADEY